MSSALKDDSFLALLNDKLESFYMKLKPAPDEDAIRYWIVHRLRQVLDKLFGYLKYDLELFGSFPTGLSLPDADLDISLAADHPIELKSIFESLKYQKWISFSSLELIQAAKVPLIKFKTKSWLGGLQVDLSNAGIESGRLSTIKVLDWKRREPTLEPMVLILKLWLRLYDYDHVYSGGLGGYALVNLCMAVLQADSLPDHPSRLARNFLNFFGIYGIKFNQSILAIWADNEKGPFVEKSTLSETQKREFDRPGANDFLVIDPTNPLNNISQSTYKTFSLFQTFQETTKNITQVFRKYKKGHVAFQLEDCFRTDTESLEKNRYRSKKAMHMMDIVVRNLSLDIFNQRHLDQIDEFLKPARKNWANAYVLDEQDSNSSGSDSTLSYDSDKDIQP
jgi:DNA polymerase sigma